jgi:predicted phage terminase large subunit-like protein
MFHVKQHMQHNSLPKDAQEEMLRLQLRLQLLDAHERATSSFIDFARYVWPEMLVGEHHRIISKALDRVISGECKRLIVAMPPRHGKSQLGSYLFPAYLMGRRPDAKLIVGSHTAELAQRFGRMIRNLVDEERYKELFPGMVLSADSKAAGRWNTSQGGEAFFIGKGGAMTGRGGDIIILDDILDEQDALSETAMENTWEWITSGPRQRLQPGGAMILINTRWKTDDPAGRFIKAQSQLKADQWEVLEFPAILPSGRPLWPEYWPIEELEKVKFSIGLKKWNAQWQQQPTNDEGAVLKRNWWRKWQHDEPPLCDYLLQTMDTAYSKKETADFSVIATWGVFTPDADSGPNLILLNVRKGRWDFPELKRIARDEYQYWRPDNVLIEAKATGTPLQQELRRIGVPVTMYSPGGRRTGQDKLARANAVAPLLESGMVWYPEGKEWAEELVEECAAFPNGSNDDQVDVTTMALFRFRQGNFVALDSDDNEEAEPETGTVEYY